MNLARNGIFVVDDVIQITRQRSNGRQLAFEIALFQFFFQNMSPKFSCLKIDIYFNPSSFMFYRLFSGFNVFCKVHNAVEVFEKIRGRLESKTEIFDGAFADIRNRRFNNVTKRYQNLLIRQNRDHLKTRSFSKVTKSVT